MTRTRTHATRSRRRMRPRRWLDFRRPPRRAIFALLCSVNYSRVLLSHARLLARSYVARSRKNAEIESLNLSHACMHARARARARSRDPRDVLLLAQSEARALARYGPPEKYKSRREFGESLLFSFSEIRKRAARRAYKCFHLPAAIDYYHCPVIDVPLHGPPLSSKNVIHLLRTGTDSQCERARFRSRIQAGLALAALPRRPRRGRHSWFDNMQFAGRNWTDRHDREIRRRNIRGLSVIYIRDSIYILIAWEQKERELVYLCRL